MKVSTPGKPDPLCYHCGGSLDAATLEWRDDRAPCPGCGESIQRHRYVPFFIAEGKRSRGEEMTFLCPVCLRLLAAGVGASGTQMTCAGCASVLVAPVPAKARGAVVLSTGSASADGVEKSPDPSVEAPAVAESKAAEAVTLPPPASVTAPTMAPSISMGPREDASEARRSTVAVSSAPDTVDKPAFVARHHMPEVAREERRDDQEWRPSLPGDRPKRDAPQESGPPDRRVQRLGIGLLAAALLAVGYLGFKSMAGGEAATSPTAAVESAPDSKRGMTPSKRRAALETLFDRFGSETTVEGRARHVRHPEVTLPRMREYYGEAAIPVNSFEIGEPLLDPADPAFALGNAVDEDGVIRFFAARLEGEEFKLDWEHFVGHSEMPWERFLASPPAEPLNFRVKMVQDDYFNHVFDDEDRWECYRLGDLNESAYVYAYIERSHPKAEALLSRVKIDAVSGEGASRYILQLQAPEGGDPKWRQVHILDVIQDDWLVR